MGKGSGQRARARKNEQRRKLAKTSAPKLKAVQAAPAQGGDLVERPNEYRAARGKWTKPDDKRAAVVDVASDEVGRLFEARKITSGQEQAARAFQALRADYIAELPDVSGFKSCLAGSVPGYDDGDGDPRVIEAYRAAERMLPIKVRRAVLWTVIEDQPPYNLDALRAGLDRLSGC